MEFRIKKPLLLSHHFQSSCHDSWLRRNLTLVTALLCALASILREGRRGYEGNELWMRAFFKAVPAVLVASDCLQMVECTGCVKEEFPLFGIDLRSEISYITSVTVVKSLLQQLCWLCTLWLQFWEENSFEQHLLSFLVIGLVLWCYCQCYCSYIYSPYMVKISAALCPPSLSFSRTSWTTMSPSPSLWKTSTCCQVPLAFPQGQAVISGIIPVVW